MSTRPPRTARTLVAVALTPTLVLTPRPRLGAVAPEVAALAGR